MELNDREKLVAPRELWPTAPAARQKDADFKLAWVYLELILEGKDAALAAWPAALAALNNHSDRHEWLLDLYTAAVARPDLWAIFASFARDLLELPVDHLACFRDVAPPPEHLDVFRPFAEGIVTEPYDPRDPLFKPLEP